MTDPIEAPPAEIPPADALPPAATAEPHSRQSRLPWMVGVGFLVLAAAQGALWVRVLQPPPQADNQGARLQAIEDRLSRLEARPTAAAPDLGPLAARVTALEQRAASAPPEPNAGLAARLAADEARLAAMEKSATTQTPAASNGLADRVTADEARLAALEKATATPAPAPPDGLADRVAANEARLAALEKATTIPPQVADRTARIGRLQSALAALAAGQPLGDIPQAPAALARYATVAPPTEPALRLAFPAAAHAALAAGQPDSGGKQLLDRLWAEAQDLVTIRRGDHVLLGDPNAGVLAHAQIALDAGDLAGAVATVATLTGPAAQVMAPWLEQARGLLAARTALADLAART